MKKLILITFVTIMAMNITQAQKKATKIIITSNKTGSELLYDFAV